MIYFFMFLFLYSTVTEGLHFNGGTITWQPINPNVNSSIVSITITQSYSWTASAITCATNVPISTAGRTSQNANLTCITDCTTDGGYSTKPINILTDCQTVSASLNLMTSQRSVNINLTAGAHFYLAYVGSAWAPLNDPPKSGLQWSIVCSIDLRIRPDGFINTPPVASVVSPQYAIVNRTTQITIPVSDANADDDVRCRWSVYTPGYRRRRRYDEEEEQQQQYIKQTYVSTIYKKPQEDKETVHIREKRAKCKNCGGSCYKGSPCCCSACSGTSCTGSKCTTSGGCPVVTTTAETPGTIKPTSSYPTRQAIDECGGICYPTSVPNGTTLSNCTISFIGLVSNTWYAVSIQVEDFINDTSLTPMSSVPVQLLIYVMDQPTCGLPPVMLPLKRCFDAQVGVSISFNMSAMTLCNPNISDIDTITFSNGIDGMNVSDTTDSLTNASVSYATFTWTPVISQLGPQQLCVIAYTDELIQSQQYCVTFNVITSPATCITTTTTSTTTTSRTTSTTSTATTTTTSKTTSTTSSTSSTATTTSTSQTTTSTSTSTTSTSTTSTSTTTTSTSTSTSTTSTSTTTTTTTTTTTSTSTSTTSTSTTTTTTSTSTSTSTTSTTTTTTITTTTSTSTSTSSTSTSTTTTTTTTTSTSTSTSSTSTSTTTTTTTTTSTSSTSTSTSTTTSTTTTSVTTTTTTTTTATTVTTTTVTMTTKRNNPGFQTHWLFILGLSLLFLLLAVCCSCFCLYKFWWIHSAKRRQRKNKELTVQQETFLPRTAPNNFLRWIFVKDRIQTNHSNYDVFNANDRSNIIPLFNSIFPQSTNTKINSEKSLNLSTSFSKPNRSYLSIQDSTVTVRRVKKLTEFNEKINDLKTDQITVTRISQNKTSTTQRKRSSSVASVSVINLRQSSIEMQSMKNQLSNPTLSANRKSSTTNRIKVTKIPRNPTRKLSFL